MEPLFVALAIALLLSPFVALTFSWISAARSKRNEQELRDLRGRVEVLSRRLRDIEEEDSGGSPAAQREPAPIRTSEKAEASAEMAPAAAPLPQPPAETVAELSPPPLPPKPAAPPAPTPPQRSAPSFDLERLLGGSLLVWIGGVALALSAAFFVKYSLDQGWVGPSIRIALGLAFGLALIGLGEFLRLRSATVAQASCAAGVAALFAALLAGTNLYALIPAPVGFAGLALTTAAAVVLSLRHGVFVAGLGLLGGFLTPALIRLGEPSPPLLFGYLVALQLGLLWISRRRGWWPLGLLTLLGTNGWAITWLVTRPTGPNEAWLGLFLIASTAAVVLFASGEEAQADWGEFSGQAVAPFLGIVGAVSGLAVLAASVQAGAFSNMEWGFLGLLVLGLLALARFDAFTWPLPWLTAAASAVLLVSWANGSQPTEARFAWIALAFGGLHAVGGFLLSWMRPQAGRWAALSTSATFVFYLIAAGELRAEGEDLKWALIALSLAAAHAVAAALALRSQESREERAGAHALGVTAGTSLAIAVGLDDHWVAAAWALQLPVLGWLNHRLRLEALRPIAWVAGILLAARLFLDPSLLEAGTSGTPVFNELLWSHALPCLAFAAAAWLFRKRKDDELVAALEIASLATGAAWFLLELRSLFHDGELDAGSWTLAELGLLACGWIAAGAAVSIVARQRERATLTWTGRALAVLGACAATIGPWFATNPLWTSTEVAGPRVFNTLLLAYGLPALLVGVAALLLDRRGHVAFARIAGAWSVIAGFLLVTLEVRHWFHQPRLDAGSAGDVELYAYSAAWILFGVALLLTGLRLSERLLRQAALGVMLVAVAKVFLLDMRELGDLWRVLSFLGLGLSLLGLGYLYQRFVLSADEG